MTVKVCKECRFYKGPSLFDNIFSPGSEFGPTCTHENARDKVSGDCTPCITMRVLKCGCAADLWQPKENKKGKS